MKKKLTLKQKLQLYISFAREVKDVMSADLSEGERYNTYDIRRALDKLEEQL